MTLASPPPSADGHLLPGPPTAARLREARRRLEDGEARPQQLAPLIGEVLARSWTRSHAAGLPPEGRAHGAPHASAAQLARAMQRQYELLSHAQPVMDYLSPHVAGTRSLIVLADAQGMLLRAIGDDGFTDRAQRVALRPGAQWSEAVRGTNAIGTALAERAPVVVHGGEHYLARNGFLTCAAAPIADPAGRLIGVFDISGDHRGFHPRTLAHTLGLARAAAGMVERRLFDTWHAASLTLKLHPQAEGLGSPAEGVLALAEDGALLGANSAALAMLGLGASALGQARLDDCLPVDWAALWARATGAEPARPFALARADGRTLWLKFDAAALARRFWPADGQEGLDRRGSDGAAGVAGGAGAAGTRQRASDSGADGARGPLDDLARLDTGDAALVSAVHRARRVLDKPISLLLLGESGVGKEVFARAAHASGPRRDGPFVAVNCAALPETLIEAELFGYQGGAFTGARREGAPGRIREAHGGTLFLDEIGDMPLAMQARLLRVLQERAVQPLGGGKAVPVDFQLICATHRRLRDELVAGRFREDLYYRINGLALQLPPLRERQDFAALVDAMLDRLADEAGHPGPLRLSAALAPAMAAYRWPGNLRQLHNALRTAVALLAAGECEIGFAHLPDDLADDLRTRRAHDTARQAAAEASLRTQEADTIARVVETCRGNLSEAARRLGISRNTLYRKLRQAGLAT